MMEFLSQFFFSILYQPLLNVLVLLYNLLTFHDLGLAVIILTFAIRVLLHPLSLKSIKSQAQMQALQPKIQEIQTRFKNNKEAQAQELMKLYQKEKINPFSGCLPVLLQLPILIALYQVFLNVLDPLKLEKGLYGFVSHPGTIQPTLFFVINLQNGLVTLLVAVLAGTLQFIQTKNSLIKNKGQAVNAPKPGDINRVMQQQMLYVFPVLTVLMVWQFKALIGLYWLFSTLGAIVEQRIANRKIPNPESQIPNSKS